MVNGVLCFFIFCVSQETAASTERIKMKDATALANGKPLDASVQRL